jgi:hypothetical protein
MNIRSLITPLIIIAGIGLVTSNAVAKGPQGGTGGQASANTSQPTPVLSVEETETLLWMREEEKLARDVYLALDARWNDSVLQRIASSEQRHFDALGNKIDQYGLVDPALPGNGEFADAELQALYDELVTTGLNSATDAMIVGATIEDMDIRDLQEAIEATDEAALKTVYGNLLEGSKNHLRAFIGVLRDLGVEYTPTYIDALLFDSIVGV